MKYFSAGKTAHRYDHGGLLVLTKALLGKILAGMGQDAVEERRR